MSGHSKWATIKRQKGANDAKRGQLFTKLASAIAIAVKKGGGVTDPESNPSLRLAIDKAKGANMPRENIDRAVQRGVGNSAGEELAEVMYEGFAPGGVGILIEAVTDKKQRTVSEVKSLLDKNGASMAGQGSVSYLFNRTGEITVDGVNDSEELLSVALESGASDFEEENKTAYIYTEPSTLSVVKKTLEEKGYAVSDAQIIYKPNSRVQVTKEIEEKIDNLIEKIEDLEDVQRVYSNLEYTE